MFPRYSPHINKLLKKRLNLFQSCTVINTIDSGSYNNSYKNVSYFSSNSEKPFITFNKTQDDIPKNTPMITGSQHYSITKILGQYANDENILRGKMKAICAKYIRAQYLNIIIDKLLPKSNKIIDSINQAKPEESVSKTKLFIGNLIATYNFSNWLIKVIPVNTEQSGNIREINFKILNILYSYFYYEHSGFEDFVFIVMHNPYFLKEKNVFKKIELKKFHFQNAQNNNGSVSYKNLMEISEIKFVTSLHQIFTIE